MNASTITLLQETQVGRPRVARWAVVGIGAVGALLLLCAFLFVLARGHLDEDAYILFTYSSHLAAGDGIVWDLAHGHAEGATDFLWMLLVAGLQRLGLDVGAAAAVLNVLGFSLSYWSIARMAELRTAASHALLAGVLLLSHITAASLGGFSAHFYCGVFAVTCYFAVQRAYAWLAVSMLVLGLVRPDGVVLAVGIMAAVVLYDRREVIRHGAYFAIAAAAAAAYFAWRWWYFGLLMPLPLIIKSSSPSLPENLRLTALTLLPLSGVLLLVLTRWRALGARLLILGMGPLLLLAALLEAHQMQDVALRFQAPITLGIVALGFCAGRSRPWLLCLLLAPSFALGAQKIAREYHSLARQEYINYFPQLLNPLVSPAAHVAMTEAGRFGFRIEPVSKLDIIGLNSPITATPGSDRVRALQNFQADLIFIHQGWTLDTSPLDLRRNWIELSREAYLALRVLDSPTSPSHRDPMRLGAMATRGFIESSPTRYFIYAVNYRGEFSHFYFLRDGGVLSKADFERALAQSFAPASAKAHCAYSGAFPCTLLATSRIP